MLQVIDMLVAAIEKYVLWIYVACALGVLWNLRHYALARRARTDTIFTVERESAAYREGRSMTNIGLFLAVVAVVLAIQLYLLPSVDEIVSAPPTPTATLPVVTTATPRPTMAPTLGSEDEQATRTREVQPTSAPTAVPAPTPEETATAVPTQAPPPPPSACADANVCITWPGPNSEVSGVISIRGSAQHPAFQFYKVEYGVGEDPAGWNSIGDTVGSPVEGGTLATLDTTALPNGVYWFRLTVVDNTGNFPPPHRVRVVIAN
ncbi:MAG: hypothetical protein ACOX2L_09275 [Anaerolineae bacterium]|jgi:hypothetical protein